MKRYFSIYFLLLKISLSLFLSNRANVVSGIFTSILWGSLVIVTIFAVTSRSPVVLGWTRNELILLSATYNIFFGIYYFLFNTNFRKFSHVIALGELDNFLLKPIDAQFLLSSQEVSYTDITRVILGILVVIYLVVKIHFTISFLSIIGYILLMLFSLAIIYSIWFIIITVTIWFPQLSNLRDLLYAVNGISRFPPQMFKNVNNLLFLALFPLTLVLVVPVKTFLQKVLLGDVVWLLLFTFSLLYISRKFWKFALRFYTSAGG